jgi:predicted nucleic acid-binding protein
MEEDRLILVDTNIFLEYLLGQKRSDECEELLARLSRGDVEGVVTRFSLHSIEAVFRSGLLVAFLGNIDRSLGLSVYDTDTVEESQVADVANEMGLDFDDAIQFYVARKLRVECIVTFDKHFDGLDVRRVEPKNLLEQ